MRGIHAIFHDSKGRQPLLPDHSCVLAWSFRQGWLNTSLNWRPCHAHTGFVIRHQPLHGAVSTTICCCQDHHLAPDISWHRCDWCGLARRSAVRRSLHWLLGSKWYLYALRTVSSLLPTVPPPMPLRVSEDTPFNMAHVFYEPLPTRHITILHITAYFVWIRSQLV